MSKQKIHKSKSEPTIKDVLVLGKFSDDTVKQIVVNEKQVDMVLHIIKLTSKNQIITVLDENLGIDFSRNSIPITQKIKHSPKKSNYNP